MRTSCIGYCGRGVGVRKIKRWKWVVNLPQYKYDESDKPTNKPPNDMSTLPWAEIATLIKTHQDDRCAAGVEEEADPIERERQVFGGLPPMQHLERWWMVQKVPAEHKNGVDGNG